MKRARDEAGSARRQLERANESIRTLVEEAPDGIFVADLSGRYTDVNAAGCRMLGYTREEILDKTVGDLLPAEDLARLEVQRQRLLEGGSLVNEWTLRRKDGTFVPVELSARILADGRWQAFVRDITVRRQLEEALAANQEDLVRAQSVAKVGSWRLDFRRNELRWSDETHRIYGLPEAPRTYEAFLACVHPDDRAAVDGPGPRRSKASPTTSSIGWSRTAWSSGCARRPTSSSTSTRRW